MGEHQDFLEEEGGEQNQPLIKLLHNVYQSGPEDARSMARIRERLLSGDYQQAYIQQKTLSDANKNIYSKRINTMNEHVSAPKITKLRPWNHSLIAIAAVFTAFVAIGSLVLALNILHRPAPNGSIIPKPSTATTILGPTATPAIPTATSTPLPTATPIPVLPHIPTDVTDIQMIDSTTGWIFCSDGSVLRTTDGGLNWIDVTPPALFGYKNHMAVKSLFPNGSTAWIVVMAEGSSNVLYTSYSFHTSDAGRTWQVGTLQIDELMVPAGLDSSITVISPQEAWIMEMNVAGANEPIGTVYRMTELYHTTDGGKVWIQIQNLPNVVQQYRFLPGISFADQHTGIVIGGLLSTQKTYSEFVYLTQDGGASWRSIPIQSPEPSRWKLYAIYSPQFLTAKDCVFTAFFRSTVPSQSDPFQYGEGFSVFSTHDGGQTWNSSPIVDDSAIPNMSVFATKFFDTQHGYALSGPIKTLQLYTTSDGGQHWSLSPLNMPDLKPSGQIGLPDFISPNTGWALTTSLAGEVLSYPTSLYKTVDGGKTWTQVHAHLPSFITPKSAY